MTALGKTMTSKAQITAVPRSDDTVDITVRVPESGFALTFHLSVEEADALRGQIQKALYWTMKKKVN